MTDAATARTENRVFGFAGIDKCRETCLTQLERGLKASPEADCSGVDGRKTEARVFATVNCSNRGQLRRSFFETKVCFFPWKRKQLEIFDCSLDSSSLNSANLACDVFLIFKLNCYASSSSCFSRKGRCKLQSLRREDRRGMEEHGLKVIVTRASKTGRFDSSGFPSTRALGFI